MVKNIFIHFLFSVIVSYFAAKILHQNTYCDSMCGFYYIYAVVLLLPVFFLIGLSVPIGLKKYPKSNLDQISKRKRNICLILGGIGMLSVFLLFVISNYIYVSNK